MEYILLFFVIFLAYIQNIFIKQNDKKTQDAENAQMFFLFFEVLAATIFLGILFIFNFNFSWTTFFFAMGFACSFSTCIFSSYMAIKTGSLSLSALISSFSIIIPALYSAIILGEKFTTLGIIGLFLLFASLILVNTIEKEKKFNFKWLFFAILSFLGNGIGSTLQKVHQSNLSAQGMQANDYAVCFQFFAMLAVTVIFGICLISKKPKNFKTLIKKSCSYASATGVANAGCNILMLLLATALPGVVLYPSVSAGLIVFTFITGLIIYKERFTKWQYIGYVCGIVSVVLLSI